MPEVEFERIDTIHRIFMEKGWISRENPSPSSVHAMNSCCRISSMLDKDQFDLFCVLLSNFIHFRVENYFRALSRALDKVPVPRDEGHVFHVAPVIAPKDFKKMKTKSGPSLIYPFKNEIWKWSNSFKKFRLIDHQFLNEMDSILRADSSKTTIIFIDDFIGTGDTVGEFLNDYEEKVGGRAENVIFLAVAIMQKGLSAISARGYNVYYDTLVPRGIADCDAIIEKDSAYKIMDSIEHILDRKEVYKYGYGQSESLISLINTPNNTFPMFWMKRARNDMGWPAPFPRG